VATLVATACGTERPNEHFRPFSAADGGASSSGSGGAVVSATGGLGGANLGGESSVGGSGPVATGGTIISSSGGTGPNGSGGNGPSGSGGVGSGDGSGGGGASGGSGGTDPYDCDAPAGNTQSFTREALRASAAECIQYHQCRFEGAASLLASGAEEFELDPSGDNAQTARAAWLEALREWSVLEVMQFGPGASASPTAGKDVYQGQGIRDLIYSWPQISRCRVDEQVALQKYLTQGVDLALISARGLVGVETLLFYEGLDTECAANTSTGVAWASLDAATIGARRRDYAVALADNVLGLAQGLVQSWSPSGGNFESTFVSASGYPDEQEAMNVLGWSLLYIEREVKDWKLGVPAGYTTGAPVSGPEARFAGEQSALLVANIDGFRRIFQGCGPGYSGLGFDDWLTDAAHQDLADDIVLASIAAEDALRALPPFGAVPLTQLQSTYTTLKTLTDLLKADLFGTGSPINLKLPASLEGDTD